MGKIPARKHHGIRDPIKQNEKRFAEIKDKIDNPPEKIDSQKISGSLKRFIELKEAAKANKPRDKIKFNNEDKPENYTNKKDKGRPTKQFTNVKMFQNETDKHYLRRVNRMTYNSMKEVEFENKYGIDVIRNPNTGAITMKKRPKDEILELWKNQKLAGGGIVDDLGDATGKKQNKINATKPVLSEVEKNKIVRERLDKKKQERMLKKQSSETVAAAEYKKDEFIFGEVVHGPPQLSIIPRKAKKSETVSRPGKRKLLLNSILDGSSSSSSSGTATNAAAATKIQSTGGKKSDGAGNKITKSKVKLMMKNVVDLKGKRKDLPNFTRRMIETQQIDAIAMYKTLKKNRRLDNKKE